eukprot:5373552-Prymnesium_polylepis.1
MFNWTEVVPIYPAHGGRRRPAWAAARGGYVPKVKDGGTRTTDFRALAIRLSKKNSFRSGPVPRARRSTRTGAHHFTTWWSFVH